MALEKKTKRKAEEIQQEAPVEISPKKKSKKKKKDKKQAEPVHEVAGDEPPTPSKPAPTLSKLVPTPLKPAPTPSKPTATPAKSPATPKPKANKKAEKQKAAAAPINDHLDESDEEKEEIKEANGDTDLPEWSKEEYLELFSRIQNAIPKDDKLKYESRVSNLDWSQVSFNEHSAEDCRKRWMHVQNRLRRFRVLSELLTDAREWADHPWFDFKKGSKSGKHPDLPKKPLSSYMLFFMEVRDKVSSENRDLDMPSLSKHIGQLFNNLPEKKKQKYVDRALELKLEYEGKMEQFNKEHPDLAPQTKLEKGRGKVKLPAPPQNPLRLYIKHKTEKASKDGNVNKVEIGEQCRAKWKTFSDETKLKWINKAIELEAAYKEAVEAVKEANPTVEIPPHKTVLSKEEQALKAKAEGKPDKPPNSGYSLFSKELLGSDALRHLESKDRMTEISRMWRDLPETERAQYNETARQMLHDYKLEFASYLDTLPAEERGAALKAVQPKTAVKHSKQKDEDKEKEKKPAKEEPAKKKKKNEPIVEEKPKVQEKEEKEEEDSDEEDSDGEEQVKPPPEKQITKPNSPLEMFCQVNAKKFQAKHPEATEQERLRLMAKAYNKLGKPQKEVYLRMAREHQETATKSTPSAKATAPATPSKKTPAPPAAKKETPKAGKAARASSPVKSSTTEGLFRNEPEKPPANVEELYANTICKQKKIDREQALKKWDTLSTSQQDKYKRQYNKLRNDYLKAFEEFLRGLTPDEVNEYKAIIAKRAKANGESAQDAEESDDSESDDDDEEEDSEEESDEESDDSD